MNNILCCNAGRRGRLMIDMRKTIGDSGNVVATDNWSVAPAIFFANKQYVVPKITHPNYIQEVLGICKKEDIKAIFTLIDPEIDLLASNKKKFEEIGVLPLCPSKQTADLCFDKYSMYLYLKNHGVNTPLTFHELDDFKAAYFKGEIQFPVFIKPRTGSGSVGAHKVNTMQDLENYYAENAFDYIIQEFMQGDCDADAYIEYDSKEVVSIFSKKKIETRIGGASKTISFKDQRLFDFVQSFMHLFDFAGAIDMDFFFRDGEYYLSEINPRFGGAYLHAYGAGVDFFKLIINNINGVTNEVRIGDYDEGVLMLMYDDVVITKEVDLLRDYHD